MASFKGGMGGGNMQNLMKQAQKMQEQLQETEKLLDDWEIVGTSGGEAVVVYMNAKKIIDGIELDPKVVDPEDVEDDTCAIWEPIDSLCGLYGYGYAEKEAVSALAALEASLAAQPPQLVLPGLPTTQRGRVLPYGGSHAAA